MANDEDWQRRSDDWVRLTQKSQLKKQERLTQKQKQAQAVINDFFNNRKKHMIT